MNGTTLMAIGWIGLGVVLGLVVGWIVTNRALRAERHRNAEQLREELADNERVTGKLTADLDRARRRITEFERTVPNLEHEIADQQRSLERIQAQIRDRESTISSLRSRLYGSRSSAALLEEELAAHKREVTHLMERLSGSRSAADGAMPAADLTVDLGDGLEIATKPVESEAAKRH